jgi:uncharacterized protein YndB with AHSA1/START domain
MAAAAKRKSNEIHLTRVYDAPVRAVWDAWTDPAQVAQWWGPRGFTLTTHSKDLRPGGHWRYTMHGPDGVDYPNTTTYFEVEEAAKLVYDHGATDDAPPLFRVTVLFSERGGKTTLDMTMTLATPEVAEDTRKFIKKASGESTWDRLAEYLEKQSSGTERFVINRVFDAPIDRVFDMWTDPAHLASWMGPTGSAMAFLKTDVRAGGHSTYKMDHANLTMYGRVDYLAIERPTRLVYTQAFTDAAGALSRHPLSPTWPETMLTVVEFTAEDADRTRITLTWEPSGRVTDEELATFVNGRTGMMGGWTGSFDKLEEKLAAGNL